MKKLRWSWEYDHNNKDINKQVLIVEKHRFTYEDIFEHLDKLIAVLVKNYPIFENLGDELKEIFEEFLTQVSTDRKLWRDNEI